MDTSRQDRVVSRHKKVVGSKNNETGALTSEQNVSPVHLHALRVHWWIQVITQMSHRIVLEVCKGRRGYTPICSKKI